MDQIVLNDAQTILKQDGKFGSTYAGLPVTLDEIVKSHALAYTGLTTGMGVGITVDCEDPVKAIKFLDYLCSDEGQFLTQWGIEGVNYQVDDQGKFYRTQEEIDRASSDPDYGKTTGVGLHSYPFPSYGTGVIAENGNPYSPNGDKQVTIDTYNEAQKATVDAWGVDLLIDVFPQRDEFEVPKYSATWAYTKPAEFTEIEKQLDEISWPALIACIKGTEAEFDATYDKMLADLEDANAVRAEEIMSQLVKDRVAIVE